MNCFYTIQGIIPEDDLTLIGCYVQTCAHIEHSMWSYYFYENPVSPEDEKENNRIRDLRLNTWELVKAIEAHIPKLEDSDEAAVVSQVIAEVRAGIQTRHSIIHGALRFDGPRGGYVLHHHWKPDRKSKEYVSYREPLPASHLRVAMDNANSILLRAHELFNRSLRRAEQRSDLPG